MKKKSTMKCLGILKETSELYLIKIYYHSEKSFWYVQHNSRNYFNETNILTQTFIQHVLRLLFIVKAYIKVSKLPRKKYENQ